MPGKILIIDDDQDILDILSLILEPEGYTVVKHTGINSLSDIVYTNPDLIILDDWLRQELPGSVFCRQLKDNPVTAHIQIIITSAHNGLEQLAAACHADGYLEKPFDVNALVNMIGHSFSNALHA